MLEQKLPVVEPETKESAGDCCVPECGPTTCEPGAETEPAKAAEVKAAEEPSTGSSKCGCP